MRKNVKSHIVMILAAGVIIATAISYILLRQADRPAPAAYDMSYVWYVDYDAKTGDALMIRGEKVDEIKDDIDALIAALNGSDGDPAFSQSPGDQEPNEPPEIKLRNIENGTIHIEVVNDEYLTQRMGTSGAQDYLATITYTLTEHPGISRVNFIFEEGDHAAPGLSTRTDFVQYYRVISRQ